ncbi:acyl-CoA dehydrogenase family protein [Inquilinus limosus]|uniref:acyl-CoA dehydrogenase family protein n=1 Tax=Inquilinus limosus TaxID=171674 RepID=UPI0003F58C35|nr:acyl-CoA dehydrogenase family protein [Inquilinus limosus]
MARPEQPLRSVDEPPPLAETVAALAAEFAGTAAEYDRSAAFPFANFQRLAEEGLLALATPRRFGGRGGGLRDAATVIGGIARGEPSTALVLSMQYLQHASLEERGWPAHLAERLGREAASGVSLINALRVEPELGSPSRGGLPATVARRTPEGWRVSGRKIFSTGIPILSWLAVWAATDEAEPRVGTILVPARAPGIRVVESWDQLGMRATNSHDVVLEDVLVPLDHAVDLRPPEAWRTAEPVKTAWGAVLIGALYDGIARAARDWLVGFLKTRTPANLGAPLATLPRMQESVGEIETRLAVNARLIAGAAREVDDGRPPAPNESGIVKLTVTGNAIAAVETAVRLTGNPGLARTNPLERHYRDVLCARIHTPQDDAVRIAAGRLALGL